MDIISKYIENKMTGDLCLDNSILKELPENLTRINGNLFITGSLIEKLPENLTVKGCIMMENSQIKELPKGLKAIKLYAENSLLESLPKDIVIREILDIVNTPLAAKYSSDDLKKMCPGLKKNMDLDWKKIIIKKIRIITFFLLPLSYSIRAKLINL